MKRFSPIVSTVFESNGSPRRADGVLGRIAFGAHSGPPTFENGVPVLPLKMKGDAFTEAWLSAGALHSGTFDELVYAHGDEILFCTGFIPLSDRYDDATCRAYSSAFALADTLRFPRIFRMWNFIPHINDANRDGLEVYRDFCRGRARAFEQRRAGTSDMPAATGVGTWGDGVGFCFLACRESTVVHIENTRQTPAYDYPARYGPKAPSFARATRLDDASGMLFVSGTASIVGHETMHAGDLEKQWQVTLDNIAHLVGAENLAANGASGAHALDDLDQIKVYYRHAADLPRVTAWARAAFHAEADIRYLNVDICRADLLVEIEGIVKPLEHRAR